MVGLTAVAIVVGEWCWVSVVGVAGRVTVAGSRVTVCCSAGSVVGDDDEEGVVGSAFWMGSDELVAASETTAVVGTVSSVVRGFCVVWGCGL